MNLISVARLALWAEGESAAIDPTDEWALEIIKTVSEKILDHLEIDDEAAHQLSDIDKRRLGTVCVTIAKRVWVNPHNHRSDGGIGPLGGDSYADQGFIGLEFTPAEEAELAKVSPDAASQSPLWSIPFRGGQQRRNETVYLRDGDWPGVADDIPYADGSDVDAFGRLVEGP